MYFCQLKQSSLILIIFTILFFMFMFHFLSTTSENFLQPALKTLAQSLRMSQTLAGLTFLAFGNGAPDMITAVVATLSSKTDTVSLYPIGSIFGACLISTSLVLANAIKISPFQVQIDCRQTPRDIIFYIVAIIMLLIFAAIGTIYWWMASMFILMYIIYGIFVIKLQIDKKKHNSSSSLLSTEDNTVLDQLNINQNQEHIQQKTNTILYYYQLALDTIRRFTIPCTQHKEWSKLWCIVSVFVFPIFNYSVAKNFHINWIQAVITIAIGIALSVFVFFTSNKQQAPVYQPILSLMAFFSSVIWLLIAGNLLINYLQFIQLITDSNPIYLGLTILAMGNTAGDYFSISAMAKAGLGKMAVAGVYGGQLFNFLIGFGAAILIGTIKNHGKLKFPLFQRGGNTYQSISNAIGYIVIFSVIFHLLTTFFFLRSQKYPLLIRFKLTPKLKQYLLAFYIIFFLGLSCLAIASDIVITPECLF